MSTGTNKERLTQNNGIISENNADLTALKTRINNLPTSGDTTATADDIAVGKTAVSKGVKLTGTLQPGIDTSDATATASDMVQGKTAYVNGVKIEGNVEMVKSGNHALNTYAGLWSFPNPNCIATRVTFPQDYLCKKNSGTIAQTPYSEIVSKVNLTPNKLKKGEVVLGVTGTYEGTSVPDWSQIGYSGVPQEVTNGFNHAQSIMQNWTIKSDYSNEFEEDIDLIFMPLVNTSSATNMSYMFNGCYSLMTVPLLNTSNVLYMEGMFNGCRILTIPQLDTSNVSNMRRMFYDCESLTTVPQLNTSNVADMEEMFFDCFSLTTVPQLNTSNVADMSEMFYECYSLTTVPQLNTFNVTNMHDMFYDCSALSNESLNNILAMCINAANYRGTRTLAELGLTSTQQATCQTLSNWNDFVEAGWSAS